MFPCSQAHKNAAIYIPRSTEYQGREGCLVPRPIHSKVTRASERKNIPLLRDEELADFQDGSHVGERVLLHSDDGQRVGTSFCFAK
jgi:hypothetical protein